MALKDLSLNDRKYASFGAEGTAAHASKVAVSVGGVYQATPPTIADGQFSRFQTDASGNLMVNLAAGEEINIGTVTLGTISKVGTVSNIGGGSIVVTAGTVASVGTIPGVGVLANGSIVVTQGTIATVGTVSNIGGGSIVVTAGTVGTITNLATVGTVSNLAEGSVVVTVGTVKGPGATGAAAVGYPIVTGGADSGGTVYTNLVDTSGRQIVAGEFSTYSGSIPLVIGNPLGIGTQACTINGVIQGVSMGLGTMSDTGTAYLGLKDDLGGTILYGTQAESGTSYFGTVVPVTTAMNWIVTTAGTQEGTQSLFFRVHYQR